MKISSQRILLPFILCSALIVGCSTTYNYADHYADQAIVGIASYYSSNLDGSRTSTGEIFRNNKYTAASNNFPLNTWVKVTDLGNGRSVIVRINDRMHVNMSKKGRVVDLPRIAAQHLDFIQKGLTKVRVEKIPANPTPIGGPVVGAVVDSNRSRIDPRE